MSSFRLNDDGQKRTNREQWPPCASAKTPHIPGHATRVMTSKRSALNNFRNLTATTSWTSRVSWKSLHNTRE